MSNSYIRSAFKELANYNFAPALNFFQKAKTLTPAVPAINVYLAYTYEKLGKQREAVKYYDDLIKSGDNKLEYIQTAVNLYKTLGDTAQALIVIKKGRETYPKNKFLLFEEANIYNNKKDYVSLRRLLNELVATEPNDADIMFLAATCYDNLNEYNQAESFYLKAIEINGNNYDPIYNLGILYLKKAEMAKGTNRFEENLSKSKQWLEKAHEITPNDINGLKILKMLYAETGNNDQLDKVNNQLKQLINY
ncbi:MAG: tetratricopeptide repeat protein [Sphingobacteriaceae bacterium]